MVPDFLAQLIAQDKAEYRRETIGFSQFYAMVVPAGKIIYITNIEINPFIKIGTDVDVELDALIALLKSNFINTFFQLRIYNQYQTYRYTYKPELNQTGFYKGQGDVWNMAEEIFYSRVAFDTCIRCTKDIFFSGSKINDNSIASFDPQNNIVNGTENDNPVPVGSYQSTLGAIHNIQSGTSAAYQPMTNKYSNSYFGNNNNFWTMNPDSSILPGAFTDPEAVDNYNFLSQTHFLNIEFVVVNLQPGA
jgi:hypothetical protein